MEIVYFAGVAGACVWCYFVEDRWVGSVFGVEGYEVLSFHFISFHFMSLAFFGLFRVREGDTVLSPLEMYPHAP